VQSRFIQKNCAAFFAEANRNVNFTGNYSKATLWHTDGAV